MNKILVYGTLRKGDYNFDRILNSFGEGSIVKTGETTLRGYKLYNLGSYPGVVKSDSENDIIVCDIVEVKEEAKKFIDLMELGSGYKIETVVVDDVPHTIYEYKHQLSEDRRITTGDWFKRN